MRYTGIGSRKILPDEHELLSDIGEKLYLSGYTLRSGAAVGSDTAFYEGLLRSVDWTTLPSPCEIFIPWEGFNGMTGYPLWQHVITPEHPLWHSANETMRSIHPTPERLSERAEALHTRNIFQILGPKLDTPSKFVIYCSDYKGDEVKGGTRTAVMLARRHKIPTFNIRQPEDKRRLMKWVGS